MRAAAAVAGHVAELDPHPQYLEKPGGTTGQILRGDGEVMQAARPAGNRYSFRMDELAMFILAGQNHRLEILEEKLSKM